MATKNEHFSFSVNLKMVAQELIMWINNVFISIENVLTLALKIRGMLLLVHLRNPCEFFILLCPSFDQPSFIAHYGFVPVGRVF